MKLMYALWGAEVGPALVRPDLRAVLHAAGATRLQVNVDDDDVAGAKLRITTFGAPVRAVASVWTEDDPAGISEVLAGAGERCSGWEVEERVPLVPPDTADGVRCPALAQMVFLRRPAELDQAEWLVGPPPELDDRKRHPFRSPRQPGRGPDEPVCLRVLR